MNDDRNFEPRHFLGVAVSSTFTDLKEHRAALIKTIKSHGLTDVAMENDSAKFMDVIDSSLQMVRDGSAYIGVIGKKYGQIPKSPVKNPNDLSITELEFNEALRLNRPMLLFIMGTKHLIQEQDIETVASKRKKLKAFIQRAKNMAPDSEVHRVYAIFESLEEFKDRIAPSIADVRRYLDTHYKNYLKEKQNLVYDINKDPTLNGWSTFRTSENSLAKFVRDGREVHLKVTGNSKVGINRSMNFLKGKVTFEYKILRTNSTFDNIIMYVIPMQENSFDKFGLIEVGTNQQDHPQNDFSPSRSRLILYSKGNDWTFSQIEFDFSNTPLAFYSIFAPRINEGCPRPDNGEFYIRNIKIYSTA